MSEAGEIERRYNAARPCTEQGEQMPTKKQMWKQTETKVAAALGGRRVPVTGRIVDNLSKVYGVDADVFWFDLGLLPPDVRASGIDDVTPERIVAAYAAMRAVLRGEQP